MTAKVFDFLSIARLDGGFEERSADFQFAGPIQNKTALVFAFSDLAHTGAQGSSGAPDEFGGLAQGNGIDFLHAGLVAKFLLTG